MSLVELAVAVSKPGRPLAILPDGEISVERAIELGTALRPDDVVLISVVEVRTLIEILFAVDGRVAGLVLASSALTPDTIRDLAEISGATRLVSDRTDLPEAVQPKDVFGSRQDADTETTWMMTTSGTTGIPKIVPHTLNSLSRTVRRDPLAQTPIWGLLYDMTRFAGLQVALQSLIGGGTLAAVDTYKPLSEQVEFLAETATSHLSATPTLWRRLLMVPNIEKLPLRQVTLGGEIADQAILDAVSAQFPKARITHIYASTEAGVGFAVNDRKAGFPKSHLDDAPGGVGIHISEGMLWLRPPGDRKPCYLGGQNIRVNSDGYILTGDRVEIADNRVLFLGRDNGVVNVGGVKIHPERVERTIAAVSGVGLVHVSARANPITGALLVATIVPVAPDADRGTLKAIIIDRCRKELEREAVPGQIIFVDTLEMNSAGKIRRN